MDIRYLSKDEIWSVGYGGTVLHTMDGGITWQEKNLSDGFLQSIDFVNDSLGYIVGNYGAGTDIIIFKTIDGGENWVADTTLSNITFASKIRFSHPELGLIGTEKGILRSTNLGNTWEFAYNSESLFTDIATIGDYAWIIHNNYVLFTNNAGNSWQDVKVYDLIPSIGWYLESIAFSDTLNGWVTMGGGKIYKTTNSGFNWSPENQISGITLNSIGFSDSKNGWAVGAGGAIIHYGENLSFVEDLNNEIYPQYYYMYQNYPNPFNASTNIEFRIPKKEFVTLKIFNILGEEVTTLVSGQLPAGNYIYDWNGSNMASGVYLYRLSVGSLAGEAEGFVETRKMVVIR
jgi:photosystem II stability/assembly factor-like uncharacterized protein